jgi:hypothetical protein
MNVRFSLVLAVLAVTSPTVALAQSSTGELRDEVYDHRVGGELGLFLRSQGTSDIGGIQPSFYGTFTLARFGESAFLQLDTAWRFAGLFGTSSAFRAMNPYAGVRVGAEGGEADGRWRGRGGVGVTLPLTNAYDDFSGTFDPALLTYSLSHSMNGAFDGWLALPLNAAVVLRGDFEYRGQYFVVGGDGALGALFPVEYRGATGNTLVSLQLGAYAGGRPIPELTLGVRFQAVALVTTRDTTGSNTEGYTSLMPFVRGEIGPGFVEGRLLMNLDDPYGWAFDATGFHVWAVQVLGGATF